MVSNQKDNAMPRELAMLKWLAENDRPTPPAASAAIAAPKPVIDLAARYNAQRKNRIFTGRNIPMELSA